MAPGIHRTRPQAPAEGRARARRAAPVKGAGASSPDTPAILQAIVRTAARLCEVTNAHIYGVEGDRLRLLALSGTEPVRRVGQEVPITRELLSGWAVLERRTIHVRDMRAAAARRRYPGLGSFRHLRTMLAAPLLHDGAAVGLIIIHRSRVRPFTAKQIALLRTFADQAAIALENERLRGELEGRNRDLTASLEQQTATSEVLRAISISPSDLRPIYQTILRSVTRLCEAKIAAVFLYDGEVLRTAAHEGATPEFGAQLDTQRVRPSRETPTRRAALEGQVVHVPDVLADSEYSPTRAHGAENPRTVLAVPMHREGAVIGVITTWRREVRPFSERQVDLVKTFADQAVIALENVRLFRELKARNSDLTEALEQQTATGEILRVISSSPTDIQPVFDTIVRSAATLCAPTTAGLFRFDGSQIHLGAYHDWDPNMLAGVRQAYPRPPSRDTLSGRAILSGRVAHVADMTVDEEFAAPSIVQAGFRTGLSVPMIRAGAPIGTITVTRQEVKPFSDKQIELLKTFADQAVIAIENVRLFQELEARNQALSEALDQQTATSEILQVISSSPTDVQPVFDTIVVNAVRLCDGLYGAVNTFDGEMVHRPAAYHNYTPDALVAVHRMYPMRPSPQQLTGRAILGRAVAHIPDVLNDPEYDPDIALAGGWRSALAVPMLREGHPIGTILVTRAQPGPFSERQIRLLETFAAQAVIAIENVRLFTELRARNRDLTEALEQQTATAEILRAISGAQTDVQPVFEAIARNAVTLCNSFHAAITSFDGEWVRLQTTYNMAPDAFAEFQRAYPTRAEERKTSVAIAILEQRVIHVRDIPQDPDVPPATRRMAEAGGYRTFVAVPMVRDGRSVGAITVIRQEPVPFSAQEIELLKTFADQAVIAIENVRLFQELQARNHDLTTSLEQQTATGEILRVISGSPTDAQPVFDTIAGSAVRLCRAAFAFVFRYDGTLMHVAAHHNLPTVGLEALQRQWPMRPDRGSVPARAILDRQAIHVTDVLDEPDYPYRTTSEALGIRTMLTVPMLREGQPIGAIAVYRQEVAPFSDQQVALVATFADQAVIAIENVRLFQELEARNRDLTEALEQQTATSEVLKVISRSAFDLQPVLETLIERAARLGGADGGVIYKFDGELMRLAAAHEISAELREFVERNPLGPGGGTAVGRALLERRSVHIHDVLADPGYTYPAAELGGYRTILGIPMLREGIPVGVFSVWRTIVSPFTEKQIALVTTFADQGAIAIENVRLFTELEARNRDLTEALEQQTATAEVLKVISRSTFDLQPVLETLIENATRLCGAQQGFIFRSSGQLFDLAADYNAPSAFRDFTRDHPIHAGDGSVVGRVALDRRTVQILDAQADADWRHKNAEAPAKAIIRTLLGVPMLREQVLIGVFAMWRSEVRPFTDKQIELVTTFADQAVIAIENVRLFTELEARNHDLSETLEQQTATGEILRVISSSPTDVQPVFDTIAAKALRLCDASWSAVTQYDGEMIHLVSHHNVGDPKRMEALRRAFPRRPREGA